MSEDLWQRTLAELGTRKPIQAAYAGQGVFLERQANEVVIGFAPTSQMARDSLSRPAAKAGIEEIMSFLAGEELVLKLEIRSALPPPATARPSREASRPLETPVTDEPAADQAPVAVTVFDGDDPTFEQVSRENGFTSWSARDFAAHLGYADYGSFKKAIEKAQQVFFSLEIPLAEHFQQEVVVDPESGKEVTDLRMSRFACHLAAINADPRKPEVAKAQAYFAALAEACHYLDQETVDRVLIRDEISAEEKGLSGVAKGAGVQQYSYFQSAGYRGLYCLNMDKLKERKGVPKGRSVLDFIGSEELAANLFRITQTRAKIKKEGIRGQRNLEQAALDVGRRVRETMVTKPENLPPSEDIRKVHRGLKLAGKDIQRLDE